MHFGGHEITSLVTQRSTRNLFGSSVFLFVVTKFEIDLNNFQIFSIQLKDGAAEFLLIGIHVYFLASLLFHWLGDLFSIGHWNKPTNDDGRSRLVLEESPDVDISDILRDLRKNAATVSDAQCKLLVDRLQSLSAFYYRRKVWFVLYFFGWYFLLPLGLGCYALYVFLP